MYLKPYYRIRGNTLKMNALMNSENSSEMSNLAKFCRCIMNQFEWCIYCIKSYFIVYCYLFISYDNLYYLYHDIFYTNYIGCIEMRIKMNIPRLLSLVISVNIGCFLAQKQILQQIDHCAFTSLYSNDCISGCRYPNEMR